MSVKRLELLTNGLKGRSTNPHLKTLNMELMGFFRHISLHLNIMIESYDKITPRQGCSLGISELGKDIGLEWREANSGNGASVSISGDIVITPQGIPDLHVLNTGFNDCGKLVI